MWLFEDVAVQIICSHTSGRQGNMQHAAGGRRDGRSTAVSAGRPDIASNAPKPHSQYELPNGRLHKTNNNQTYKETQPVVTFEKMESDEDVLAAVNFLFLERHGGFSDFPNIQQEHRADCVSAGWTHT